MRAVLLASATATTRLGRRWRSAITHGSALVAFERGKLALAPLIRSRRKYGLPRLDIRPGDVCHRWNSAVAPDLARPRTRARERNGLARIARDRDADEIAVSNDTVGGIEFDPAGARQIDLAPCVGRAAPDIFGTV